MVVLGGILGQEEGVGWFDVETLFCSSIGGFVTAG